MLSDDQRAYIRIEETLRAGDLDAAREAFGNPPDFPNAHDPLTWTHVLALAIAWSPLPLVRRLLELGSDPNYEAADGFPSLTSALDRDQPDRHELLELLLAQGADVNQRGINDYTPLHLAVARCDDRAIAILLAHGADPSLKTRVDEHASPLEEAERMGNTEGASLLRRALEKRR